MYRTLSLVLLLLVGCGGNPPAPFGMPPKIGPSAEKEGLTWSHKELLEYLKAKGMEFYFVVGNPGGAGADPMVIVAAGEGDQSSDLRIILKPTVRAAADMGGTFGVAGFAWGRFVFFQVHFRGYDLIGDARKALGVP